MDRRFPIHTYSPEYQSAIRRILTKAGWAQQYSAAMEEAVGYLYIQHHAWNGLSQIQGLAVGAEEFARSKNARGIYVDTPTNNDGYRFGYLMPRSHEDGLDGVTCQKFFDVTTD